MPSRWLFPPYNTSSMFNTSFDGVFSVNGGYSEWGPWSQCSVSCGSGQRTMTRDCNNPVPKDGGKNCEEQGFGEAKKTEACNEQPCSVNGTASSTVKTTQ